MVMMMLELMLLLLVLVVLVLMLVLYRSCIEWMLAIHRIMRRQQCRRLWLLMVWFWLMWLMLAVEVKIWLNFDMHKTRILNIPK
jgi:hypothetical protein